MRVDPVLAGPSPSPGSSRFPGCALSTSRICIWGFGSISG